MTEGQPQGDLFANKPQTEQSEQTPSLHYPVGQGRKRLPDLKAIAEAEIQTGDRTVGETLLNIINTPKPPQSLPSNISNASTPTIPSRETTLPQVNTYPVRQGAKRLSIEDLKARAEAYARTGDEEDRIIAETLQNIINAKEAPGSPPTPTINQAPEPPHSSNG